MYANIQKFIQFQLTVNVGALVINVVAAVSSGDVPLNTVQVSLSLMYFFHLINLILPYCTVHVFNIRSTIQIHDCRSDHCKIL